MGVNGDPASVRIPTHRDLGEVDPPTGYKRTEVGIIPSDWDASSLQTICSEIGDGIHATPVYSQQGRYYFINGNNIRDGRIVITNDTKSVDSLEFSKYETNLNNRTVLLSINGTIGNVALFDNEPVVLGKSAAYLTVKSDVDRRYFFYSLQTATVAKQFDDGLTGTTIKNLGLGTIRATKIPIPPTPEEQHAIAEALSDVDELLGALEAVTAKNRAIKQGVMQQLLTGRTRLPGFRVEWQLKRLGDHLTFLSHGVNSRAELSNDGRVQYLHYGDIHTTTNVFLDPHLSSLPTLSTSQAKSLDRLQDGDLVLVDASEDLEGVGKSVEIKAVLGQEMVSGLHTIAIRFDKDVLADGYKAYLQFCPIFRNHLRRLAAGTKVYATNSTHISSVEMLLPSTEEQIAIAAVLSDMDAEIKALEEHQNKTRAIKQGMMQQLLTGRIRLVKPEPAEAKA